MIAGLLLWGEPLIGQTRVPPSERLWIASLELGGSGIEQLYHRESERLAAICKDTRRDCWSRNVVRAHIEVGVLHARPVPSSPVVARLYLAPTIAKEEFERLAFKLELALAATPKAFGTWLPDVGDWGYGVHIAGVRVRGNWVELFGPPMPENAWLQMESPTLSMSVTAVRGEIVSLSRLRATGPDGRRRVIGHGSYLIERVTGRVVEFRREVPSDFACGDDIAPPAVMPPRLRAAPSDLFDSDGTPRFSPAYPKGC